MIFSDLVPFCEASLSHELFATFFDLGIEKAN